MKNNKIIIIGAGLAGLSSALFLKKKRMPSLVLEGERSAGGLCRSVKRNGFTFDHSGHLLHFRKPPALSLAKKLLAHNLSQHKRAAWVYSHERFIPYPFQNNFQALPEKQAALCLKGLLKAHRNGKKPKSDNFLEWIHGTFGKGIAEQFMVPYNKKFWRIPLKKLTCEWADRLIVVPEKKDVLSCFKRSNPEVGYNALFWYPKQGGIEELVKALTLQLDGAVALGRRVVSIDLKKRTVGCANGITFGFDTLISTVPLPELGKIIRDVPPEIESCFKKLRWLSIYNINLGVKGVLNPKHHWIYFSQKELPFFRVGFYNHFSSSMAPKGTTGLYVEISYSKTKPLVKKTALAQSIKQLEKVGILKSGGRILSLDINDITYGYPIYDKNYSFTRQKILSYLSKHNLISSGRYGSWCYASMEDVILQAQKLASGL